MLKEPIEYRDLKTDKIVREDQEFYDQYDLFTKAFIKLFCI